jgi:hypothetical protein
MTGLRGMIRAELAKREEASANYNPFSVIVQDTPKAMTDVTAAVASIEEQYKTGGDRVRITSGIAESVYEALESRHGPMFKKLGRLSIIARVIVDSHRSGAPVPQAIDAGPPSPGGAAAMPVRSDGRAHGDEVQRHNDEVTKRAAERIAAMREQF